jgi:hypothetical protein
MNLGAFAANAVTFPFPALAVLHIRAQLSLPAGLGNIEPPPGRTRAMVRGQPRMLWILIVLAPTAWAPETHQLARTRRG